MADFVLSPNLPGAAKAVILGKKYTDVLENPLKTAGIDSIFVPDNLLVDERLSGHADLSVFHAGKEKFYLAPQLAGSSFAAQLEAYGADIQFAGITQLAQYPHDAQLNAALIGNNFIYSSTVTFAQITEHLSKRDGMKMIDVRQGYAKCSVLAVDERSIITADRGIAVSASSAGCDVLLITPGHVALDGFEYGFIGGAGFKLSRDTLAFTGSLKNHPDSDRIIEFLSSRGVRPLFLTEHPVFDIGSAIPFIEL